MNKTYYQYDVLRLITNSSDITLDQVYKPTSRLTTIILFHLFG